MQPVFSQVCSSLTPLGTLNTGKAGWGWKREPARRLELPSQCWLPGKEWSELHEAVPSLHGTSFVTELCCLPQQGLRSPTAAWGSLPQCHHLDGWQRSPEEIWECLPHRSGTNRNYSSPVPVQLHFLVTFVHGWQEPCITRSDLLNTGVNVC